MLEEGRANGHGSANANAEFDRTRSTLKQFRRRTTMPPWRGDKLLDYYRRDRKEEESAAEFLNALRRLASEAGFLDCHKCHNRDMMLLGRLISGVGDEAITDQILGLDSAPSAEEIDRICGTVEEQRATTMPPLKRKKQWAAAAASGPRDDGIGKSAAKRRKETEAGETAAPGVTHYDCVSATSVAGTLVINGETLVSKVRQQRRGSSDAATTSPSALPSPHPSPSSASPANRPGSPDPNQGDGNLALKVSPPHGAIEFGADGCESPPPLAAGAAVAAAQRRPVYVRPIASLMAEPSTSSAAIGRDLLDSSVISRPGAPTATSTSGAASTSNWAASARRAQPLTDVVPAKRGGGKGTKLKELLPAGWPMTAEQTANMDMQKLEHLMATMQLSMEDVEKVKQVRRLEKNRRAAKKSRNNTVQAMEKLRYSK